MQRIASPPLSRPLQKRFFKLVKSHMRAPHELAAGMASLPSVGTAFAATQGAWRFLNNERVKLPALVVPAREVGQARLNLTPAEFGLLVHDWCKLTFQQPARKQDLVQLTHETDVGYELTTALLVSAADGSPLAPMEMHLKTAKGVLSTRSPAPPDTPHLEQVLPTMRASRSWGLNKLLLHVIDREADSVDHYRVHWAATKAAAEVSRRGLTHIAQDCPVCRATGYPGLTHITAFHPAGVCARFAAVGGCPRTELNPVRVRLRFWRGHRVPRHAPGNPGLGCETLSA